MRVIFRSSTFSWLSIGFLKLTNSAFIALYTDITVSLETVLTNDSTIVFKTNWKTSLTIRFLLSWGFFISGFFLLNASFFFQTITYMRVTIRIITRRAVRRARL